MTGALTLSDRDAEAVVRLIEAAQQVQRRSHFFVWMQAYLQPLLPHQIAICGAYHRRRKDVVYEAFDSVAVAREALALLTDGQSAVLRPLVEDWVAQRGRASIASVARLAGAAPAERALLLASGIDEILVHGVARPARPADIECLFLLTTPGAAVEPRLAPLIELLMPHLQATYLRVQAVEREIGESAAVPAAPRARAEVLTGREREILSQVRDGKSNQEIGDALAISALTVKNHIQTILRKLGAANRAQAVARAMALNLMAAGDETPVPPRARR